MTRVTVGGGWSQGPLDERGAGLIRDGVSEQSNDARLPA